VSPNDTWGRLEVNQNVTYHFLSILISNFATKSPAKNVVCKMKIVTSKGRALERGWGRDTVTNCHRGVGGGLKSAEKVSHII
jgi:hypothetical protein